MTLIAVSTHPWLLAGTKILLEIIYFNILYIFQYLLVKFRFKNEPPYHRPYFLNLSLSSRNSNEIIICICEIETFTLVLSLTLHLATLSIGKQVNIWRKVACIENRGCKNNLNGLHCAKWSEIRWERWGCTKAKIMIMVMIKL